MVERHEGLSINLKVTADRFNDKDKILHNDFTFSKMATLTTLISLLFISNICAARNLLKNGDLESTNYSGNWGCLGGACTLAASQDSFSGAHSMNVSNRSDFLSELLRYVWVHNRPIKRFR